MTMRVSLIASLFIFILCSNAIKERASTIVITSNAGNSAWWLAYAISDPSTTSVELSDSGNYITWQSLQSTNWGYWTFSASGNPVIFPISLRLSNGESEITLTNIFESPAPGSYMDTLESFPSSGSLPTQTPIDPSTVPTEPPLPTDAPQTPTPEPTSAPASSPSTEAPSPPTEAPAPPTQAAAPPTQAPAPPTEAPTSAPPPPPPAASAPTPGSNPFAGTTYYINPHYTIEVDSSIAANPSLSDTLSKVKAFASAFWIDRMSVIDNVTTILTQARLQATSSGGQVMAAIVVYDLPSRDCAAAASNGEISCADSTCADGINTYKTDYIDPLVAVLQNFPDITIVAIIEPDSLPNLATNLGVAKCALAETAYKTCVSYAIQQLSQFSNVYQYIDAAHGGWLGWTSGLDAAVGIFQEVIANAGGASKIRGFSTNVANYQPLGSMTDTDDPCNLASQYNFAINEVKYVNLLDTALAAVGITGMHYIIDTGRNGVPNSRTDCSNWCNIKNAGLGVPPTSDTSSSGLTNIDAYFWVKPPGESDGTSNSTAPRYDYHCGSVDSRIPAPEAGEWFSDAFVAMAAAANPPL